jgi:hypothetical protein
MERPRSEVFLSWNSGVKRILLENGAWSTRKVHLSLTQYVPTPRYKKIINGESATSDVTFILHLCPGIIVALLGILSRPCCACRRATLASRAKFEQNLPPFVWRLAVVLFIETQPSRCRRTYTCGAAGAPRLDRAVYCRRIHSCFGSHPFTINR